MNVTHLGMYDIHPVSGSEEDALEMARAGVDQGADIALLCSMALDSSLDIEADNSDGGVAEMMRDAVVGASSRLLFDVWRDLTEVSNSCL